MKRARAIRTAILVVLCVLCAITALSCSKKEEFKFYVCTDIHVVANSAMTAENYSSLEHKDKMKHISDAIFRSFIDELIEKKAKYLLVTGDLTEDGDEASARAVADALKKAKDNGINAFVINGNHDVNETKNGKPIKSNRLSKEKFAEIFAPYGYEQAIERFDGTLSYVADMDDKHRLIAIDNIEYVNADGTIKDAVTEEHRLWIEDRVAQCAEEGKTPVIMAHKPLMKHLPSVADAFMRSPEDAHNKGMIESFAGSGAKAVFVGHLHFNDVKEKTVTQEEKTDSIYEIMTNCLAMYNTAYREVVMGEKMSITSVNMERVNKDYLPEFLPKEDREKIEENYSEYAEEHLFDYMARLYYGMGDENGMLGSRVARRIGKYADVWEVINTEVIKKTINTPYYKKDEIDGTSMERTLEKYGLAMPEVKFKNFTEFANDSLAQILRGDRDFTSDEFGKLIKYTVYQVFENLAAAQDKINKELQKTGADEKLNLNTEYLYKEGKLECYESNFMPIAAKVLAVAFGKGSEGSGNWLGRVILSLAKDLTMLNNTLVVDAINGFTGGVISGYEKYIGDKEIDLGGLVEEGLVKTYLKDFTVPTEPSGTGFETELQ